MNTLTITDLPLSPSLNNCYRNVPGRGRVLTDEARAYKDAAAVLVRMAARREGFVVPPRAPLRVSFRFWFDNVQRDGDNAVKLIQDSAALALGFNDRWVVKQSWEKHIDKERPRCDIEIEVLAVEVVEAAPKRRRAA